MAVGPVVGYVHQFYVICKSKSVGSFSIDICGILLFANILRLNFYIFEKYELSLLFQSIIMILAQVLVLTLWYVQSSSAPNMLTIQIQKVFNPSPSLTLTAKNLKACKTSGDGNFSRLIVRMPLFSSSYCLFHIYHFQCLYSFHPTSNLYLWSYDWTCSSAFRSF